MKQAIRTLTSSKGVLRMNTPICRPCRDHFATKTTPPIGTSTELRLASNVARVTARQDRLADFTKDEEIDTSMVQLKQPDGKLSEPQSLRSLLHEINREDQVVIQRSKPGSREVAVVEICERRELLSSIREKEDVAKQHARSQREQKPKQIEMNWAIGENDLDIKLKQLEQFVEKGKKVEILLAAKKRQRRASEDEAKAVLKKIKDRISDIGAKEITPMEGALLKQATLTVKRASA